MIVVARVFLTEQHFTVGKTRHLVGSSLMVRPSSLDIVSCDQSEGFYLLYINSEGKELTDTFHESVKGAIKQAQYEFGVGQEEWNFSDRTLEEETSHGRILDIEGGESGLPLSLEEKRLGPYRLNDNWVENREKFGEPESSSEGIEVVHEEYFGSCVVLCYGQSDLRLHSVFVSTPVRVILGSTEIMPSGDTTRVVKQLSQFGYMFAEKSGDYRMPAYGLTLYTWSDNDIASICLSR